MSPGGAGSHPERHPAHPAPAASMAHGPAAEPIAVVGAGCRFPGGAEDPDGFWRLLRDGACAVTAVPAGRGDVGVACGAFLEGVDRFDAGFFRIAAREAVAMDPQQRLILMVAWEAIEDAGQTLQALGRVSTGVFLGVTHADYAGLGGGDPADRDVGTDIAFAAGRLSHCLGLHGPSLVVSTACSSSLVAVHLACQSLRSGDCDVALAGGANLILAAERSASLARMGLLSAGGRCAVFEPGADGFVRGEGCGVVVLRRLSDATADHDPVRAVILGSAVNHDGSSGSLTLPHGPSQQMVIRRALATAAVPPARVGYVEAHAIGSRLGDPIEVNALRSVLGTGRDGSDVLHLGSVKANIGHLEAAAGVAGLIKTILCLQHREIPPHPHLHALNPHIPWDGIAVATRPTAWPGSERRVAGVSSFGMSGTNAHVVVAEAPEPQPPVAEARHPAPGAWCLPLSARDPAALASLAERYRQRLARGGSLADLCFTAAVRRSHHEWRLAAVGRSDEELSERLGRSEAISAAGGRPPLAFVFCGQGCGPWETGGGLRRREPVFRAAAERCEDALRACGGRPEDEPCALFALQVALAALWRSWGIEPEAVVGHSVGEAAAAHVAGALSLEDAAAVVACRHRIVAAGAPKGTMAALDLAAAEAEALAARYGGRVSVAAVNGPTSTVLSGPADALAQVAAQLVGEGRFATLLDVDHAFHSADMEPLRAAVEAALRPVSPRRADLAVYSTVTGAAAGGEELDASYWWLNLRQAVRFRSAIGELGRAGYRTFVEIGPHPVLGAAVRQCLEGEAGAAAVLPSLRRGRDDHRAMFDALGALYARGCEVRWDRVYPHGRATDLPRYPWRLQGYWVEAQGARRAQRPLHESLTAVAPYERRETLEGFILREVADLLRVAPPQPQPDPDQGFFQLGMESMQVAALRDRLGTALGNPLPITALFEYPTARSLAAHLAEHVFDGR